MNAAMIKGIDTIRELNAFELARLAECGHPDAIDSAGAEFLASVLRAFIEMAEDVEPEDFDREVIEDYSGIRHQAIDGSVPFITHQVWATFTDLAAYQEDPSELGYGTDGVIEMERLAQVCLYLIADRLGAALADAVLSALIEQEVTDYLTGE